MSSEILETGPSLAGESRAAKPAKASKGPVWLAGVSVLAAGALGGTYAIQAAKASHSKISAASAALTIDQSTISFEVPGTVKDVFVKTGDRVKAGQVIAIVNNSSLVAEVQKAQKALTDAEKETNSTQATIVPPPLIGGHLTSHTPVSLTPTVPITPLPAAGSAGSGNQAYQAANPVQLKRAKDVLSAVQTQNSLAQDRLTSAKADLDTANHNAEAIRAPLDGLQANLDLAKAQRDKFQGLFNDGIISRNEFQQKQADVDAAQTAIDQANDQIKDATTAVATKKDAVDAATKALSDSVTQVALAQKTYDDVSKSAAAQVAPAPTVAEAPLPARPRFVAMPPPLISRGRHGKFTETFGGPNSLMPVQVSFQEGKHQAAQTKLEKAQAELAKAQVALELTKVVATQDGTVTAVDVKPGQYVGADTPAVTIAKPASEKIVAQFSHGSALRIHNGQPCDITILCNPNYRIKGRVEKFLDGGTQTSRSFVEISLPDDFREVLAQLPPGTASNVTVLAG